MFNSGCLSRVPVGVAGDITGSVDVFLVGLQENVGLQSSLFSFESAGKIKHWLYSCSNDQDVSGNVAIFKSNVLHFAIAIDLSDLSVGFDIDSILF